jgi:hypothetical protein
MKSLSLCVIAALAAGCARSASVSSPRSMERLAPEASAGVARLRDATKSYRALDSAVAAGYAPKVDACLVHEHHGAMGYHHSNPKYVDKTLDVTKPELLLYERMPGGEYRLNGVEFILPYRFWPRDSVAPTLMGQTLHREDNLKFWYLHTWAWTDNADGIFADFNPAVQCGADRKVFIPFEAPPSPH